MRRLWVTVVSLSLLACSPAAKVPNFRVALVTPGSIADAAWNSGAYAGLLQLHDSLDATISNVEARTPAEQEEALRSYAAQGYDIVFGHGFEFQALAERVAADYPNTIFVITSGERVVGKVTPMVFRIEEATYLAGLVAGAMTKTGIIGFVGGIELPPIKRGYEGWTNGARAMDPKVQSRLTYLNSFDDAALGLFQAVKEDPKVRVVGANADQSSLAPGQVLGSAVLDLPRAFLLVGREVKGGTFVPHLEDFGVQSGVVRFDWDTLVAREVPAGVKARVAAARDSIAAGTLHPLVVVR